MPIGRKNVMKNKEINVVDTMEMNQTTTQNSLGMRILIIDDDKELTTLLKMELEDFHHQVFIANDGTIGEEMAMENEYDVIVLDVMLPGTDGYLICKALRKNSVKVPVLMISSLDSSLEERAGFIAGANDYLIKPFEFEEFHKKIMFLYMLSKLV
jgi:DNA-binding response OmpR family regulator